MSAIRFWTFVAMIVWTLDGAASPAQGQSAAARTGVVEGRVLDAKSNAPIAGVTVTFVPSEAAQAASGEGPTVTTGPEGAYRLVGLPTGRFALRFEKPGYTSSTLSNLSLGGDAKNVLDQRLAASATSAGGASSAAGPPSFDDIEEMIVEATPTGDLLSNVVVRLEADQLLNTLSAEEMSKFAASDVGDALKRMAGVNVVGGQFAVIRGLEDRYSSTLFNGAPLPSPDPTKQSVQLDLFPSDIVSNLQVAKTFGAASPSNSAGGSINILTQDYPDDLTFKVSLGSGFNERALDEFRRYDKFSATGVPIHADDTIESDYSALFGGRDLLFGREVRFKLVFANEIDFETRNGMQWSREPQQGSPPLGNPPRYLRTGGLALGELNRPGIRWDTEDSIYTQQRTYYAGLGMDLDEDGMHRIDGSFFRTEKTNDTVQHRDRGHVPGVDYASLLADEANGNYPSPAGFQRTVTQNWAFDWHDDLSVANGKQSYYAPLFESRTIGRERDLSVYQLNGEHDLADLLEGLKVTWAANYAQTNQDETAFLTRYSFQPNDPAARPPSIPSQPRDFPGGGFYATRDDMIFGENRIRENQYFSRIDLSYEANPFEWVTSELTAGYWFEQANRDVISKFETNANANPGAPGVLTAGARFAVTGATSIEMGRRVFQGASLDQSSTQRPATSAGKKEISAGNVGMKLTFLEKVDVIGRVRIENFRVETTNDAFTGFCNGQPTLPDGSCPDPGLAPDIYPSRYLFFDRFDNPNLADEVVTPTGTPFNDQILNIKINRDDPQSDFFDCRTRACLTKSLNGEINDTFYLPEVSAAYRPIDDLAIRFAYSQTVARPSFRELGYYPSLEIGIDELTIGNPQLKTSDVESFDGRVEWVFGEFSDLVAASGFYKTIQDPIESILLRDPSNRDCTGICQFRTYTNTKAEAKLKGVEIEARKTIDFLPWEDLAGFFEAFSVGGNFTYIDAKVKRNPYQIRQFDGFFGATDADRAAGLEHFSRYNPTRRLFGQPTWIGNADVSFNYEPTGTKLSINVFAMSEVLNAVGAGNLSSNNGITSVTLDRYLDAYYQLDLVGSQDFEIPSVPGQFTFKASIKNLTDTTRKVIYDQKQTVDDVRERSYRIGRDYSFAIGYTLTY